MGAEAEAGGREALGKVSSRPRGVRGAKGGPFAAATYLPPPPVAPRRPRAAPALAQEPADAAAPLSGRPARVLPELASPAAGDVLAVCALDLAEELDQSPGDDAMALCRRAVRDMVALRQQL